MTSCAAHRLVDLHCHVIPNVDDGADSEDIALAMLRALDDDGVALVMATPHAHHCPAHIIPSRVARLNQLAERAALAIRVLPGHEIKIGAQLAERLDAGQLLTLNHTHYVLLELPLGGPWPSYVDAVVDELQSRGYRPILAHAERYPDVQRNPHLVEPLIRRGVPVQLNADSFGERAERGARPTAEYLIAHRLGHLLGSDAHSDRWRAPGLGPAFARVSEVAGEDYAEWMIASSRRVVRDEAIELPAPLAADDEAVQ